MIVVYRANKRKIKAEVFRTRLERGAFPFEIKRHPRTTKVILNIIYASNML